MKLNAKAQICLIMNTPSIDEKFQQHTEQETRKMVSMKQKNDKQSDMKNENYRMKKYIK